MRHLRLVVGVAALLAPSFFSSPSSAGPSAAEHPFHRLVERERGPARLVARALRAGRAAELAPNVVRPPGFGSNPSALDCVHAKHDVTLDPKTGATSAVLELTVRAKGKALSSVGLVMDEGLALDVVTADGRSVVVKETPYSPVRLHEMSITPALQPGESTTLRVPYAGTLACGEYPESDSVMCAKGEDFSYFPHQSVIPYVYDPKDQTGGTALDSMTRDLVLRVPEGTDVIVSGERVSETTLDGKKVSTWIVDKPQSRGLGVYVLAGKLGLKAVPGRAVPTTFVFPSPESEVDQRLVAWSAPVLDFVEKASGRPLPFARSMTLVKLPASVKDPGTATFGMTLLSETYASAGSLMHEETWAHENAHLFWGIVVPETDAAESRLMSEGMATLTEIDYTWAAHFSGTDRDRYLARRFVPISLDVQALAKELPPVQLAPGDEMPADSGTLTYTTWAYFKTSMTLDHLRATIGDDVFARGLSSYIDKCSWVGCGPTDFRGVLEAASGKDLKPFFDRWVTASTRPTVNVGFAPVSGGADVELTKDDDAPMTLELWLGLDDGRRVKRRVDLAGRTTKVHVDAGAGAGAGAGVRTVSVSPRHDALVDVRSVVDGDLDFDGETDGIDLLRCTPLVGQTYRVSKTLGLWTVDSRFDPRCDVNGDNAIDESDIAAIQEHFGTMRTP